MVEMKPTVASYFVTNRCENNCPYCFAFKGTDELSNSEVKQVITLLKRMDFKGVLLSGGEPTLRQDLEEIIGFINGIGMQVYVDTSGDTFFRHKDVFMRKVHTIGLPIDFPDKSYRNSDNCPTVIEVLRLLGGEEQRPRVRIGTVITKDNLPFVSDVGNVLARYSPAIDIWKIYEFIPQGINAFQNRQKLEVTSEQFDVATATVTKMFSSFFKVVISRRSDRSRAHFMVTSIGEVCLSIDDPFTGECAKRIIGSIFDQDILIKWQKEISENYLKNIEVTF